VAKINVDGIEYEVNSAIIFAGVSYLRGWRFALISVGIPVWVPVGGLSSVCGKTIPQCRGQEQATIVDGVYDSCNDGSTISIKGSSKAQFSKSCDWKVLK